MGRARQRQKRRKSVRAVVFEALAPLDQVPKVCLGLPLHVTCAHTDGDTARGDRGGSALPRAISSVSKWWMCVAFLSIGISTDCRKLLKQVQGGGAIILYLVTNGIDMALALGLSALCFGVWRRA